MLGLCRKSASSIASRSFWNFGWARTWGILASALVSTLNSSMTHSGDSCAMQSMSSYSPVLVVTLDSTSRSVCVRLSWIIAPSEYTSEFFTRTPRHSVSGETKS